MKKIKRKASNALTYLSRYKGFRFISKLREKKISSYNRMENEKLSSAEVIKYRLKSPISIGLVKDNVSEHSYWPKFSRFLEANQIPFSFLNPKLSNFLEVASGFDLIVWRVNSEVSDLEYAKPLIYTLEKVMGKTVLPSYDSVWLYEEKINQCYLLKSLNIPMIETFVSRDLDETLEYLKSSKYPIVSKLNTASASAGVMLLKNQRKAIRYFKKVFSVGAKTELFAQRQKNYAYLQPLVENSGFDLRIIRIGDSFFGYYRYPNKNDFRASGSGLVEKMGIPLEALEFARRATNLINHNGMLAVDLLFNTIEKQYQIIEVSIFVKIETSEQLMVDGIPGRYIYDGESFEFKEGRFWVQDLMLVDLLDTYFSNKKEKKS